jgi:hypothetical protein
MALPLLWLGAAALSALTVKELSDDRKSAQQNRRNSYRAKTLLDLNQHEFPVAIYPSDTLTALDKTFPTVTPKIGAVVCCGVGGILDHTGIWVGDNTIIELDGNGLIKPISSARFLDERSGKQIFILCDSQAMPLALEKVAEKAIKQIYQYVDYHILDNNCHQFIWQCFQKNEDLAQNGQARNTQAQNKQVSTFKQLNEQLAQYFNRVLYWDVMSITSDTAAISTVKKSYTPSAHTASRYQK